jgi:hypothetical protein
LKVNLILTSLAFCNQFFSFFSLAFYFLGDFWWICWAGAQHQTFLVKFCRISWMPEHEVETKWPQFVFA